MPSRYGDVDVAYYVRSGIRPGTLSGALRPPCLDFPHKRTRTDICINVASVRTRANGPACTTLACRPRLRCASCHLTCLSATCRLAISLDAIIKQKVTVGIKPSGTCVKNAVAAPLKTSAKFFLKSGTLPSHASFCTQHSVIALFFPPEATSRRALQTEYML